MFIAGTGSAAIMNPWLRDLHRPDAGDNASGGQMSVADDLTTALIVDHVLVRFDPAANLGLDGLAQQSLGTVAKNLGQHILRSRGRHFQPTGGRLVHGAYSFLPRWHRYR